MSRRDRQVALGTELVVLVALLIVLGVAAGKLYTLLERMNVSGLKSLPIGVLFLAAAYFTARRISSRWRGMRRGNGDGS